MWRWSHARHHTDTIIVTRDPEIQVMHPVDLLKILGDFFETVASLLSQGRIGHGSKLMQELEGCPAAVSESIA